MKRLRRLWRQLMGSCGLLLLTALLFFVAFNSISAAQTTQQVVEEEQAAESEIDVAPVTVDGEDLFMVVGVSAHPAEERAPDIALRIVEVAEKGRGTPNLRIQRTEFGPAVYIDGIYITTVTQVDEEFEGLDAPTLAKRVGERIKKEILAYRERRSDGRRRRGPLHGCRRQRPSGGGACTQHRASPDGAESSLEYQRGIP